MSDKSPEERAATRFADALNKAADDLSAVDHWFDKNERFAHGSKQGEYLADVGRDDPAYLHGLLLGAGDRDAALIRSRLAQRYLKQAQTATLAMQTALRRAPEDSRITSPLSRAMEIMTSLCVNLSAEEKRLRDELEAIR